ncbi:MucBP domain-containing protein [Lacticaseibacillus sp. GG6-2]
MHYVNAETGATLQPDKVTSGSQGVGFTETAPALDGYTVVGSATADGKYAGSAMDLTFNYQPLDENSATTLTVHYVNAETGATLQPDKVTSGSQGAEFTETAPALDGYTVVGSATVDGKYAGSAMDLTFNYQPLDENSATTLTVHYVNAETGATLQPDKVTSGIAGADFTETAPALDGYTVVGPATVDGKYAGSAMDLTFNYQPLDENSATMLTVHYVNVLTGKAIQDDKTITGSQGTAFTETAPIIAGYRIQGDASVKGMYQGNVMDLTFSYLPDGTVVDETTTPATLTVHYINVLTGKAIQDDKTTTSAQGTAFTETAPVIKGYRIQGDASATGTYQGNAVNLTFSYLPDGTVVDETTTPATLTVHYINVLTGETIQADKVVTGAQGTAFTEAAPAIAGYRIQGDDSAKGTYQGNAMDLTFSYLPDGKKVDETATPSTLTVHYVNSLTGKTIQTDKVTSGTQGTAFTEAAPVIKGYRVQGDATQSGTYQGNAMNLTFSYLPDGTVVDETATPATLTVHYVNVLTGESIQADKVATGTQGMAFTETAPAIAGYRIQGGNSARGTYRGNAMDLTFSYLPDGTTVVDETTTPATLTVHYVNALTGETIQTDKVTSGTQGTAFTEAAPVIKGYRVQGDATQSGTYQGNAMDLTFSYLPDGKTVDETATPTTLTVHYVNVLTGESIQADKVATGTQGTAFTETAPVVAGYRIQGNATEIGTYQGNTMDLTFSYLPDGKVADETSNTNLTVHYVDGATGKDLQPVATKTGERGTAFTEVAPAIAGYQLRGDKTVTGIYTGNSMSLTFTYDAETAPDNGGQPTTPDDGGQPTTPDNGGQPTTPDNGGQPTTPDGNQPGQPSTPTDGSQPGQPTTPGGNTTTTPQQPALPQTDGNGTSTFGNPSTSGNGASTTTSNNVSGSGTETTSSNLAQTATQAGTTSQGQLGNATKASQLPVTGDQDARNLSGLGAIAVMLMSLLGLSGKRKHDN